MPKREEISRAVVGDHHVARGIHDELSDRARLQRRHLQVSVDVP